MRHSHPWTVEKTLYCLGIAAAVFAAAIVVWAGLSPAIRTLLTLPCPFRQLTGFYCPGCGGTRAAEALLSGRILESLWLHPLVAVGVAAYLVFMGSWTLWQVTGGRFPGLRYRTGYVWGLLALTVGNWLLKNGLLLAGWTIL